MKEEEIVQKMLEEEIEVLFLQEIDLKDFTVDMMKIPGYDVYVGGGDKKRVATFVKHKTFSCLEQVRERQEKAQVWIEAEVKGCQPMLCEWAESRSDEKMTILGGDFNLDPSKFSDQSYSMRSAGEVFLTRMRNAGLERISFGNTFERTVKGKCIKSELDWVLTSDPTAVAENKNMGGTMSDHSLITWKVDLQPKVRYCEKNIGRMRRNLKKINRDSFLTELSQQPWEILPALKDAEAMAIAFNKLLLGVLDRHAPFQPIKTRSRLSGKPSKRLRWLRRKRDNLRSKGRLTELKELRKECNKLAKEEAIQRAESKLKEGPHKAWAIARDVLGKQAETSLQIKENGVILSKEATAEAFNHHFMDKVKRIQDSIPSYKGDPLQGAKERVSRLGVESQSFQLLRVEEENVKRALKKLKASQCPDVFGISPAVLKMGAEVLSLPLMYIVNTTILRGEVPKTWKMSRVIPLHKKGPKNCKQNYRPVSILPSASKVMEEVVRHQLAGYFEQKKILPNTQFGFRKNRSTILAAASVEHDWKQAKQKKLCCGALFFDLSAAFDCIDMELLTRKMALYGVSRQAVGWIRSYLSGREQKVDCDGVSSQQSEVKVGSPQGSILSPLLFLIMVADMEEWVKEGILICYADDTSVYAIAKNEEEVRRVLEKAAREVLAFMTATRLAANASKTNFLYFSGKAVAPIMVGEVEVEEAKEETLLGITFNKKLSWKSHLAKLEPELRKRIGILRRLRMKVPSSLVCQMIEPVFTSKLRYGTADLHLQV